MTSREGLMVMIVQLVYSVAFVSDIVTILWKRSRDGILRCHKLKVTFHREFSKSADENSGDALLHS